MFGSGWFKRAWPGTTGRIATCARQICSHSRALVAAAMDSARKSTAQRARILEVVAVEEKIREEAREIGEKSRETAERSEEVAGHTERGSDLVDQVTVSMQQMAGVVASSSEQLMEFLASLGEMEQMVTGITGIAQQTHLLALNAAIEAANAGRAGEGFTIIAGEVRQLAARTRHATEGIEEKIIRLRESAQASRTAMAEGQQAVERCLEQNQTVRSTFSGIRDEMQELKRMSAEVARSSDQQLQAVEEARSGMDTIEQLSLDCTHESDAAAEMSLRLVSVAGQLGDAVTSRHELLSRTEREERRKAIKLQEALKSKQQLVDAALARLEALCGEARWDGTIQLGDREVPALHFGKVRADQCMRWIDAVSASSHCTATVFARSGDTFLRVSTTVKRDDGSRAVGTPLNPRGAAVRKLLRAQRYQGAVYVLGRPFVAAYAPVLVGGEVAGALYAGIAMEDEDALGYIPSSGSARLNVLTPVLASQ